MTERIRTTITVSPEVHEVFVRMADTAGTSLGRCIGDWLADTIEGAQFVAQKMAEARRAPKTVMREFHAMSLGLADEVTATLEELRRRPPAGRPEARGAQSGRKAAPPSSNTGGKVPGKTRRRP